MIRKCRPAYSEHFCFVLFWFGLFHSCEMSAREWKCKYGAALHKYINYSIIVENAQAWIMFRLSTHYLQRGEQKQMLRYSHSCTQMMKIASSSSCRCQTQFRWISLSSVQPSRLHAIFLMTYKILHNWHIEVAIKVGMFSKVLPLEKCTLTRSQFEIPACQCRHQIFSSSPLNLIKKEIIWFIK